MCGKKGNNWNFSLDKNSTEPYGLYLSYDRLNDVFPGAQKETIYDLSKAVEFKLDQSYFSDRNSLLISITSGLYLNEDEIDISVIGCSCSTWESYTNFCAKSLVYAFSTASKLTHSK